jgi:pimeloyl-ACP methyl ester carboxylesterase
LGTGSLRFTAYQFENSRGKRVPAELAYLSVPENRKRTGSRMIRLAVLRFRSTASRPGDPIIYLAGGPGASAIEHARGVRFPAFMALRRAGDVIALEQRGTGLSSPNLACPERVGFPNDFPLTREQVASRFRVAAASCAAYWRRRGADLAGYNILESADDIEALRQALGARQVVLWGVSYGSQLGLVTLRRHPTLASRAILAGVIGPDDTWPLPSAIDLRFDTISGLGLTSEFRSVLAKLDSHPVVVRLPGPGSLGGRWEGDSASLTIGGYDFLSFVSGALGDPLRRATVPALLSAAGQGELGAAAPFILRDHAARSIGSAMAYATSCASGSSAMRRQRMTREASQSVLAPTPNLVEASCDVWGVADLGEGFRQPVRSDVPTLLISGTLDETTPMENAVAVLQGLSRGQHLILVGARHGNPLVVGSPMIVERMLDFLAGRPLGDLRIQVPSSLTP